MPKIVLNRFCIWLFTLGLLASAPVAFWLGFQDVIWPVSLSAQLLGLFFLVAGLAGMTSAALLVPRALLVRRSLQAIRHGRWRWPQLGQLWVPVTEQARPLGRWPRPPQPRLAAKQASVGQITVIAAGAVAGVYVDVTIVAHSFRYDTVEAALFGLFGLLCLGLAWRTLPVAWPGLSQYLKGVGISVTVLGAAAGFWYQSFYLPENTQVGIQYGISVVSVVKSGTDRLVTLNLTMENESSVPALTVGSMIEVFGVSYTKTQQPDAVSNAAAQDQLNSALAAQNPTFTYPVNSAAILPPVDLSIRYGAQQNSIPLALIRPVNNDSLLFPDDASSRDFQVVIPEPQVQALDVQLRFQYARTSRLALGYPTDTYHQPADCLPVRRAAWFINQSALVRFTRGGQIFYSDWCGDVADPFIAWGIESAHGSHESGTALAAISSHLGIFTSSRDEMFTLP